MNWITSDNKENSILNTCLRVATHRINNEYPVFGIRACSLMSTQEIWLSNSSFVPLRILITLSLWIFNHRLVRVNALFVYENGRILLAPSQPDILITPCHCCLIGWSAVRHRGYSQSGGSLGLPVWLEPNCWSDDQEMRKWSHDTIAEKPWSLPVTWCQLDVLRLTNPTVVSLNSV